MFLALCGERCYCLGRLETLPETIPAIKAECFCPVWIGIRAGKR